MNEKVRGERFGNGKEGFKREKERKREITERKEATERRMISQFFHKPYKLVLENIYTSSRLGAASADSTPPN